MSFLNRLFCKHQYVFMRNLYGDQINSYGGRSRWQCAHCGKTITRPELVEEPPASAGDGKP